MIHRWEGCERVSVRSRRKRAVSARGGGEGGTSRPTGGGGANNRENIPSAANAAQGVGKIAREMRAASPLRARATAVCTAINYGANTIVGASFLPLVSGIGLGGTYALYAVLCFTGFVFVDNLGAFSRIVSHAHIVLCFARRSVSSTFDRSRGDGPFQLTGV